MSIVLPAQIVFTQVQQQMQYSIQTHCNRGNKWDLVSISLAKLLSNFK